MLTITLRVDGKEKTYSQGFISGYMFRRSVEFRKVAGKEFDETVLDMMAEYVVELFEGQFTVDEFYKGVAADKMMDEITRCANAVSGKLGEAIGTDGNDDPN